MEMVNMSAFILKYFTKSSVVVIIGLLLALGYMKHDASTLTEEIGALNATIEGKSAELSELKSDYATVVRYNLGKDKMYTDMVELYKATEVDKQALQDKVGVYEAEAVETRVKLAEYQGRLTEAMLLRKPTLLERKIKAATKVAFQELHELTQETQK